MVGVDAVNAELCVGIVGVFPFFSPSLRHARLQRTLLRLHPHVYLGQAHRKLGEGDDLPRFGLSVSWTAPSLADLFIL